MSQETSELGATQVRITFRTFKQYVQKLHTIAQAHDLRLGSRLSIGAALNLVIGRYDASDELAKVESMRTTKKKGAKR